MCVVDRKEANSSATSFEGVWGIWRKVAWRTLDIHPYPFQLGKSSLSAAEHYQADWGGGFCWISNKILKRLWNLKVVTRETGDLKSCLTDWKNFRLVSEIRDLVNLPDATEFSCPVIHQHLPGTLLGIHLSASRGRVSRSRPPLFRGRLRSARWRRKRLEIDEINESLIRQWTLKTIKLRCWKKNLKIVRHEDWTSIGGLYTFESGTGSDDALSCLLLDDKSLHD